MKPFFPDNHFQDHVETRHASKETTQWLKAILLENYKELYINNDTHIDEICGSNINSGNYRIGDFYIKTIKHNKDKEYILEFPSIVKQLTKRNIPSASYIPNNQGQLIYDYDCVFFKNTCPHRSKKNKSKKSRKMLYYSYTKIKKQNLYKKYFKDKKNSKNKTRKSLTGDA